jgi:hypothetical protein
MGGKWDFSLENIRNFQIRKIVKGCGGKTGK